MPSAPTIVPRGPYRNGIKRREQIVESASAVFAEFGYTGGSLRTIADRIGASPATLIQHFGSKQGLLQAVLEDWDHQTADVQAPPGATGLAFFRHLHELMHFHLQHRGLLELFLTMSAEATSTTHPAREFIQQRYVENHQNWARELRAACDRREIGPMAANRIEAEVRMLTAVADGLELQWLLDPSIDLPGHFQTYVQQAIARWQAA